ncbi:MAG: sensor histidine kinase [Mycobacteriales bacterium]
MKSPVRLTIRIRLTLAYGGLFLLGGLLLIGVLVYEVRGSLFSPLPHEAVQKALRGTGDGGHPPDDNGAHHREEQLERGFRTQFRNHVVHELLEHSLVLLAVLVLLSVAAGWLLSGRITRRLRRVTEAARRAGEETLHHRLALPGPDDEIKELGDTFDEMLARLDAAFGAQRRFVANASHELRTPLAATRAAVEVTLAKPQASVEQLRAMGEDVRVATRRAERLIDSLLTLARSESELVQVDTDDLADLAAEAVDLTHREAAAAGLTVDQHLGPAPVTGDVALLSRAVANLIENAVRHNTPGGTVTVVTSVAGDRSVLEVANTGDPVDPDLVPRLFEPFHRGEHTRLKGSGTGLGLSIVRAVATLHGGTVAAEPHPSGGLVVRLSLPQRAAAPDDPGHGGERRRRRRRPTS